MQTILITGGTGLVGKALTKILLDRGYQVIVLTRDTGNKKEAGHLRYAAWDVKGQVMDTAALLAADHIVHLAGAGVVDKKWTAAYKKEIVESRTESSRLLVESLTNNPGNKVKTVVSASAIGYYGADGVPVKPFTETDTADAGFLGKTCTLWEESIEPVTRMGIRLVKLRTGIVLSNEGGALAEFKKPVKFGIAGILGNGRQAVSWIHIDDLCRMFIRAIEDENTVGVYNAVAPQPVNNKTLTLALAKAMKGNFYIPMHVPVFVLKMMMGDRSIEVLKSATVSCKKILDTGFQFHFENIKTALANLVKK
ncbi:MAG TPA: TIGR01777 family oxidoreductase [Ferruginibacter sp.]|nr:TIGR01777 family oxidoreductase [Ferruginibacter sp.]